MKTSQLVKVLSVIFLLCFFVPFQKNMGTAKTLGEHPAYLHALSDLRVARWMIDHVTGDWKRSEDEMAAVREIDKAIGEIKKAAIDDGKDLNDHPKVDEHPDHIGRLHDALEFLRKARTNISHEEDNKFADGLQARAYQHIDAAIGAVKRALHE